MDTRKKKLIGIAAVVVVIIAIIVIATSSGSEIEGEWVAIRVDYGGAGEDLYDQVTFIFYDDDTVDRISYSGSVSTYPYSYSKGRLAIDGEVVDCTIHGETMRWDYEDGTGIELRRR